MEKDVKNNIKPQLHDNEFTHRTLPQSISAYEMARIKDLLHGITLSIGDLIKERRNHYKISIATLANTSHVSSTVITDLENARSLPRLEVLLKLVVALDIPFDVFFSKYKYEQIFITNSKKPKQTLEDMIKSAGLGNLDTKDVMEFIEFKKYKNSKRK